MQIRAQLLTGEVGEGVTRINEIKAAELFLEPKKD